MNKILIDTMHVYALLTEESKDGPYFELSHAIETEKIGGVVSVAALTELIRILGENIYKEKINELISSSLEIVDIDQIIAIRAGELRMQYKLSTADSQIAATGIVENVKHILTDDSHFDILRNLKKINLRTALIMAK